MSSGREADPGTAGRILDAAERLVQLRGFNGFSYADVAGELGVTKASLHYHYASKADLGEALISRYAARFADALIEIGARPVPATVKLADYAELYGSVLRDHRMCLCGMLAAEYETLSEPMRAAVMRFFDDNEAWLEQVLEQGNEEGSLGVEPPYREAARGILGGLEGALLIARPYGDPARFDAAAGTLLDRLAARALD